MTAAKSGNPGKRHAVIINLQHIISIFYFINFGAPLGPVPDPEPTCQNRCAIFGGSKMATVVAVVRFVIPLLCCYVCLTLVCHPETKFTGLDELIAGI